MERTKSGFIAGLGLSICLGAVVLAAPPASASAPGCSIAQAPLLDLGVPNAFTTTYSTCTGKQGTSRGTAYSLVDLPADGTLRLDVDATNINDYIVDFGNDFRMAMFDPSITDYTVGTAQPLCTGQGDAKSLFQITCKVQVAGRYVIRWINSGKSTVTAYVEAPAPKVTTAQAAAYKKASRLRASVGPDIGHEWQVQLQKFVGGQWVSSGPMRTTHGNSRKFNPKRGTYRVLVLGQFGYPDAASNEVWIRK